jgi:putative methyltransferase
MHADFLECDPYSEPYSEATHIIVDPSCCRSLWTSARVGHLLILSTIFTAGSGIHSDFDDGTVTEEELQARLKPLSQFQRHILSAALRFPNAQKVTYSTCSIHKEEDEDVVFSILDNPKFNKEWRLEKRENALPDWPLRGMKEGFENRNRDDLEGMIRCERRLGTHGFFVAVFVRKEKKTAPVAAVQRAAIVEKVTEPKAVVVEKVKKGKKQERNKKQDEAPKKTTAKRADTVMNGKEVVEGPDYTLLRLATLDRKRRARMTALRAIRKLTSDQHGGCCGCAH